MFETGSVGLAEIQLFFFFLRLMTKSADPDQLNSVLNLHCLQRQGISRFSRTRVKMQFLVEKGLSYVVLGA